MAVKDARKHGRAGKLVYFFGSGKADGDAGMKNLLGGKGANLAEMASLGLPVPPGFTITTEVCTHFYANGRRYPAALKEQVAAALSGVERILALGFPRASRSRPRSVPTTTQNNRRYPASSRLTSPRRWPASRSPRAAVSATRRTRCCSRCAPAPAPRCRA